jgi:MFS family permease
MPAFAALRVPAYRRLLLGVTSTEVGLYAFETALFWTVLERTGSAVHVSLLFVGLMLPVLVLTVPIGVLTDRVGPRTLLLWSSIAAAFVVGLAGVLAATTGVGFEVALLLAVAEGVFFGCYAVPAQVVAGRVVDRAHISSAIGLSAIPSGVGSIIGGALGGFLLTVSGPAPTFIVAAVGLALSVPAIAGLPALPGLEHAGGMALTDVRSALRWVRASPVATAIVLLGAVAGLFVMSRFSLLPVVVRDVLEGGPGDLGLLTTGGGAGMLLGTVMTDVSGRRLGRGRALLLALALAALGLAGLGVSSVVGVAVALAGLIAAATMIYHLTSATLLQLLAPARMRGRVLAIFDVIRLGFVPVGSLAAGAVVDGLGASSVLLVYGGLTLAAVVVTATAFAALRAVDPEREAAAGLEPATTAGHSISGIEPPFE